MAESTDLVVAAPEEAERIAHMECPWRELRGIDVRGIDAVKLSTLHGIVRERTPAPAACEGPIAKASDAGPWVFRVADSLVAALSALDRDARAAVAERWGQTEEFEREGWTPPEVELTLELICSIARSASPPERALLLWTSR